MWSAETMTRRMSILAFLISPLVGLIFVSVSSQAAIASPPTVTIGHIIYSYDPGQPSLGATIVGEDGALGDTLAPPETITVSGQEYSVSAIQYQAFENNSTIRHVFLPASIRSIGDSAFSHSSITDIALNEGLLTLGVSALWHTNLVSLVIPSSVTSIGTCVACSIPTLIELQILAQLTVIPDNAFSYASLTHVEIPSTVTTIGNAAFYNSPLVDIDIPGNVTSLGDMAFINALGPVSFQGAPPSINNTYPPFNGGVQMRFTCPYASSIVAGQWNGFSATAYCAVALHADGGVSVPFVQTTYGGTVLPPPTPTRVGYDFAGWYTSNTFTTHFDFDAPLFSDTHAYAKWVIATDAPQLASTGSRDETEIMWAGVLLALSGALIFGLASRFSSRR